MVPRRVTAFLKLQANFEQTFAWKVVKVDRPAGDKNFATHAHGTKQTQSGGATWFVPELVAGSASIS